MAAPQRSKPAHKFKVYSCVQHILTGLDKVAAAALLMFEQDLNEEVQFLIPSNGKPVKVAPGHNICRQGDTADCIWLLHEDCAQLCTTDTVYHL